MQNNADYKFFNTLFLKVSVSAIYGIGEYLSIGIGENFCIGAALTKSTGVKVSRYKSA